MNYDAAGNLTSLAGATLTYDNFGRLSSAGSATFTYDSAGRRVSKTVNGHTVFTLYDGSTPIAEVDGSGNIQTAYTWGAQGLISDRTAGSSRFYKFDALGNTRALLDSNGSVLGRAAYTAWGSTTANTLPNTPFTWAGQFGQQTDTETGLVLCGVRYYAPSMGRFISRDPSGFRAGPNVYAYCVNDAVNFYDRTGLEEDPTDDTDTFGGWGTNEIRPAAEFEKGLLEPYNAIRQYLPFPLSTIPAVGPLEGAVSLHDAFWKWGTAAGNTKASAFETWADGVDAMVQFGGAVAALSGPAVAGVGKGLAALEDSAAVDGVTGTAAADTGGGGGGITGGGIGGGTGGGFPRPKPVIEDGDVQMKRGWTHIDARHVTGNHPDGAGTLFAPGTTRAQLQNAAEAVVKQGERLSNPMKKMQTFEKRMTVNGRSDRVKVYMDSSDGSVITIHPLDR